VKVIIEGRAFLIEFAYRREAALEPYPDLKFRHERDITTCLIRDGDERKRSLDPHIPQPVITEATVVRYYKDPPNREVARKHALAKALANLDEPIYPLAMWLGAAKAKDRRRLFWEAYLGRKKASASNASSQGGSQ
jgi:hypothetical protein